MKKLLILFLLFGILPICSNADLSTGLTHVWNLNETSGNRSDSVGSLTLTDENTVGYGTGKNDNAAHCIRSNVEDLYSSSGLNGGTLLTGYTVSGWVKADSWTGNNAMFSTYNADGRFRIYYAGGATLTLQHIDSGGNPVNVTYNTSLSTGVWYFWAATWNGSTITLYLNDSSVGTPQSVASIYADSRNSYICGWSDPGGGNEGFDGYIDEVYFWNTALSGTDITELYNSGAGTFYPFGGGVTNDWEFYLVD